MVDCWFLKTADLLLREERGTDMDFCPAMKTFLASKFVVMILRRKGKVI